MLSKKGAQNGHEHGASGVTVVEREIGKEWTFVGIEDKTDNGRRKL